MSRLIKAALAATILVAAGLSHAAEPFKIGLILPLSGPFASTGKQILTAANLYMQQKGDTIGGRKIELIVKDDGGLQPEVTKRLAQELATQDKVNVLAGFGLTPLAFAAAPIATQAKIPMVVMSAATDSVPQRSPYIVRTSRNMFQLTAPMADWAANNKIKSVITLVSDYGPGIDAETIFTKRFAEKGGKVLETLRIPLKNPDFAPFLRRIKDTKPDALFVFVPSGVGSAVMKQFTEKGLGAAGIKLIGTGDVLDDDILPAMGTEALGIVTTDNYSAAHDSPENKAYVEALRKFSGSNMRPNVMSLGGYDGMHLIYEALKKAGPDADGDKLLAAMKGLHWVSPRGPVHIDPETRDIVQNIYIRRSEMVKGEVYNIEFDKYENFKGPAH